MPPKPGASSSAPRSSFFGETTPRGEIQGLDSVIDDPTFLEDGCKLEAAISRAATSIVSQWNYVEFFRLSSTSQKKLAFLFSINAVVPSINSAVPKQFPNSFFSTSNPSSP